MKYALKQGELAGLRVGFALCGSFCTFEEILQSVKTLVDMGCDVYPIMSFNAANMDTRFGTAEFFKSELHRITGHPVIATIQDAEPIGPKGLMDIMVVAPMTGNSIAKMANGIADTPVLLAAKSQLRNSRPVVLGISTNDALSGNARNIGTLLARKNIYFVPFRQDNPNGKPTSVIADYSLIPQTITAALEGRQLQPIMLCPLE